MANGTTSLFVNPSYIEWDNVYSFWQNQADIYVNGVLRAQPSFGSAGGSWACPTISGLPNPFLIVINVWPSGDVDGDSWQDTTPGSGSVSVPGTGLVAATWAGFPGGSSDQSRLYTNSGTITNIVYSVGSSGTLNYKTLSVLASAGKSKTIKAKPKRIASASSMPKTLRKTKSLRKVSSALLPSALRKSKVSKLVSLASVPKLSRKTNRSPLKSGSTVSAILAGASYIAKAVNNFVKQLTARSSSSGLIKRKTRVSRSSTSIVAGSRSSSTRKTLSTAASSIMKRILRANKKTTVTATATPGSNRSVRRVFAAVASAISSASSSAFIIYYKVLSATSSALLSSRRGITKRPLMTKSLSVTVSSRNTKKGLKGSSSVYARVNKYIKSIIEAFSSSVSTRVSRRASKSLIESSSGSQTVSRSTRAKRSVHSTSSPATSKRTSTKRKASSTSGSSIRKRMNTTKRAGAIANVEMFISNIIRAVRRHYRRVMSSLGGITGR